MFKKIGITLGLVAALTVVTGSVYADTTTTTSYKVTTSVWCSGKNVSNKGWLDSKVHGTWDKHTFHPEWMPMSTRSLTVFTLSSPTYSELLHACNKLAPGSYPQPADTSFSDLYLFQYAGTIKPGYIRIYAPGLHPDNHSFFFPGGSYDTLKEKIRAYEI
jgi:hypothetical protein